MNGKFFIAIIVSSFVAFWGGWLIFGFVFADYYSSNMNAAAAVLTKDPPSFLAIGIANIAWSILIAWVLQKSNSRSFVTGFLTSLWVSFLIMLAFDLSMYAFWDFYKIGFLVVDIILGSLFWAVVGGVAGAILGSGKKIAVTT